MSNESLGVEIKELGSNGTVVIRDLKEGSVNAHDLCNQLAMIATDPLRARQQEMGAENRAERVAYVATDNSVTFVNVDRYGEKTAGQVARQMGENLMDFGFANVFRDQVNFQTIDEKREDGNPYTKLTRLLSH